jgi:uncharacterized membrane protein SpoIIM required for sporulation
MREAFFIKRNKPRWEEFEAVAKNYHQAPPDKLADLFVQVTNDLSFAQTQYPNSRVTKYLNGLATKLHLGIYKNKREETSRFVTFWKYEVPAIMIEARKPMIYSFIIFIVAAILGVVSTLNDDRFVRLIMGDQYVNMTLENIKKGDPTAVYGSMSEGYMFLMITLNNIMVSFKVFMFGLMATVGCGFYLFYNGIMVGTFMTFMGTEGELTQAIPVIMLHGTIELTSIAIAGGAGFLMGNSLLFPGTYPRLTSFKNGAFKGMKIVVGLVPFFIIAGFIESFVTRYGFMHWSLKFAIIGGSAFLMIWYFIFYPLKLKRNGSIPVY